MSRGQRIFTDDLAFRVTPAQRGFLEKLAEENGIGIGKAARICIDEMMKNEGVTT